MAACVNDSRTEDTNDPFSSYMYPCRINSSLCRVVRFKRANSSKEKEEDHAWLRIKDEAQSDAQQEPILRNYYCSSILRHSSLESALGNHLAVKLSNSDLSYDALYQVFFSVLEDDWEIKRAIRADLEAVEERDPACISYVHCFLNFKGFLAIQAHRIAHKLWSQGRASISVVIQNRVSEVFAVDIHPGARIGQGILLDHATGVVIGETAVIGDDVSILHNVTLGGTGKVAGDRHPKVGDGVMIGAGAKVLGNVRIGEGAKIGAGSVVLKDVPPKATAVGNPARVLSGEKDRPKM
ncbi:Serine O-acetyltransferase [Bertholletia excelsa]